MGHAGICGEEEIANAEAPEWAGAGLSCLRDSKDAGATRGHWGGKEEVKMVIVKASGFTLSKMRSHWRL